ncbi:MAG TPA: peptidoglycan DD-metalloendopeptidase family protein [Candidatus Ozemobacteraceae bacterium]
MNRKSTFLLMLSCVALVFATIPVHLHAEDPLKTLQDHEVDGAVDKSTSGTSTSSGLSPQTAEQMEKTVTGLEALVKQYESLIKKLEGQVKDAESAKGEITGTVEVNTRLNIRSGPWGKIIGKLSNDDKIQIVAKEGDWFKIRHGDGFAYVHSYYVNAPGYPSHRGAEPPVLGSNQSPGSSSSSSSSSRSSSSSNSSSSSSSGGSPAGSGSFGSPPCSPMPSRTSSEYGPRALFGHSFHSGIDLPVPTGTRLNALGDGTVVATGYESGGGRFVKVRYANGYTSFYCHLQSVSVRQGQSVRNGQEIARSDNTGQWTTGAHLHMSIYNKSGASVNPRSVPGIKLPPK